MTFTRTHALLPAVLVLAGAALSAPAHAQNLLQNGSFEQGTFTSDPAVEESLAVGSTALTGWTTTNAELGWVQNGNAYNLSTPSGSYFLDLTGSHDSTPYGGVTQTLATTVGQSYHLSFALGSNQNASYYIGPVSAMASAGTTTQTFVLTPPVGSVGDQWQTFGYDFVADSDSTPITVTGLSATGGDYLGLDAVSVTSNAPAAVPEASTTISFGLLLALGLGSLAFAARKKARSLGV